MRAPELILDPSVVRAIATAPRPIVLIDGRSGSGKTTLGQWLAPQLGAHLVHLDDFYPGWDGLQAASDAVHEVVIPESRWQAWDWERNVPAAWHTFPASVPLVIEGTGALSAANCALATFGIWVELDAATRKQRALDRDGELYAAHWDRWAVQEDAFATAENPRSLADMALFG